MSPFFGSRSSDDDAQENQLPLLSQLGPEIESQADRLSALPLPALAAEILTTAFSASYEPSAGLLEFGAVVDAFLPAHGTWTGTPWKAPAPPEALLRLNDVIREGLQVLEHAGLLAPKGYNIQGDLFQ